MNETPLVTGTKYDGIVRFVLLSIFVVTGGGVVLALSGQNLTQQFTPQAVVSQPITVITPEVLAKGVISNQLYTVLLRDNGEYAFVQVQNANIDQENFLGQAEVVYQNGEAKLTPEVNGMLGIYDASNKVVENAKILLHGVAGITLEDGSTLPVKVMSGRVVGGKLYGQVELWSLKDNSRILGNFDTRDNFSNISINPSLLEVDNALVGIGKEVLNWFEKSQSVSSMTLPGVKPTPTPTLISGAIKIDPVTGLAIINGGAVGDAQIANGSITVLKLADGSVTTVKISDGAVTEGKVAGSAITEGKIADGAVTSAKLADGTIANSKLAQITEGDKVAGSAVQLRGGGGLTNDSGLSLLTSCSTDQVMSWDGDSWECKSVTGVSAAVDSVNSLSGALTIAGSGINTVTTSGKTITIDGSLPSVGTAGTYGTSTSIPVFTTDANGRVSGVTNTAISGLTGSNLSATAGISNAQLSNSSIYFSAGSGISVSGSPVALGDTVTISGVNASTSVKGVASFNSTNFSVASGAVNTIQNIDTTATPLFNSLTLNKTTNQLVLGTTNTTTISSIAPSVGRTATIPALSSNDTFVFLNQSGTLTNKTLDAGSNTISNITNANLSGSAAISDANLATITTGNKVSGSAVQLNANGGITNSTGLSLLTSCTSSQILKWNGSAWACATDNTGGTPSVYTDGGLLSDGTGLSLLRTCSDNQVLKWTVLGGWACAADNTGGGGSETVAESDGSPSVGSVTTIQFGPVTTSSEEFVVTDQGSGIARVRLGSKVVLTDNSVALTNKTIDGTLNTLQNIADSSLSTITTSNKVSGSAVQLSVTGGLTNSSGLSLLTTCSTNEMLVWNGSAWVCGSGGSGASLSSITAATLANTINNADYAQTWNFALTSATKTGFTFGESSAAINGAGSQYLMKIGTLTGSTAAPLGVFAQTYPIIDTTAAGGVSIGNATLAQAVTVDAGAGAINIGNSAVAKTITIGNVTGAGALNMYTGTGNFVLNGAGATTYSIGAATTTGTFDIGGTAQTGTANLFTGTGTMSLNIGTGASAKTITVGNNNTSTAVNVNSGTGGISLLTTTSGNLSLTTGTTGTVTLDSGTNGTVYIGTGANAKTINLGTGNAVVNTINIGGTGANSINLGNTQNAGSISLGNAMTTGTITVGGTAQTGTMTLGSSTGTNTLNIAAGTGATTLNLANAQTAGSVNVGGGMTTGTITVGGTAQTGTMTLGSSTGTNTMIIAGGTGETTLNIANVQTGGAVNIGTGMTTGTISIGGTGAQTGTIVLGTGTGAQTINLGTGAGAKTISLGSTNTTSRLNLNAGTGGIYTNGLTAQTNGNVTVCINSTTHLMYYGLTSSCNTSSRDTKHSIEGIALGIEAVRSLRPVSFEYNGTNQKTLGFIAEEVAMIDERPVERDETGKIVGLNYDQILPILTKGIQDIDGVVNGLSYGLSTVAAQVMTPEVLVTKAITENDVIDLITQKIAAIFKNTVEFLSNAIFHGDVAFLGRPTFNKDMAGFAIIKAGGSEVEIVFGREYVREPVVTATVQITGGASVADIPGYAVADVSTRGFKIRMSHGVGMDLRFAWMALAVSNTASFEGVGGVVVTPNPTPIVELTPAPTSSPTPTVTPEVVVTPELTPTPTPTEEVFPSPTPMPTIVVDITPDQEVSTSASN